MRKQQLVIVPPAVELLITGTKNSFWPVKIRSNPTILTQARMRLNLFRKLDLLFCLLPATTEISEAVDSIMIQPKLAAEIYGLLADFLDADPYNKRLVLYLPFELLPHQIWKPKSPELAASLTQFIASYMRCWRNLLAENDVHANFVDGNILEPELSPDGQKMVRKAAHLIPWLLQKEFITTAEVTALMNSSKDQVLKDSIADVLPVLVDLSSLKRAETKQTLPPLLPKDKEKNLAWFRGLAQEADFEIRKMKMRQALDSSRGLPQARVAWEYLDREEKLISAYADRIASMLVNNLLPPQDVHDVLSSVYNKVPFLAVIYGIGKAVETIAKTHPEKATELLRAYRAEIRNLWLLNISEVRDALISVLCRLASIGTISNEYLQKLGFTLPKFDAFFPDIGRNIEPVIREFTPVVCAIDSDPELSQLLYPVAIFYGSFLKGYARSNADLDIGVFVRNDVTMKDRPKVKTALSRIFAHKKINGKVVEFWLAENNGRLYIQDFPDADVFLADSTWAHLLFASVWFGKSEVIQEFYEKLLPGFIYSKGKTFEGHDIRKIWLEEMERGVLQYRLMHKGYKRFYAEQGGINTEHSQSLGPESSFWDSGYRRVATRLFISRVFLPQLAECT